MERLIARLDYIASYRQQRIRIGILFLALGLSIVLQPESGGGVTIHLGWLPFIDRVAAKFLIGYTMIGSGAAILLPVPVWLRVIAALPFVVWYITAIIAAFNVTSLTTVAIYTWILFALALALYRDVRIEMYD